MLFRSADLGKLTSVTGLRVLLERTSFADAPGWKTFHLDNSELSPEQAAEEVASFFELPIETAKSIHVQDSA